MIKKIIFESSKTAIGSKVVGLVFSKGSKILPVKKVKENKKVVAFWHPKPFWEQHIVIVPKKSIKSVSTLSKETSEYISEVFLVASSIVKKLEWDKDEYSITVNGGKRQEVNQIHFHLHKGIIVKNLKKT
jgi:histidine triad (HIT) family protein